MLLGVTTFLDNIINPNPRPRNFRLSPSSSLHLFMLDTGQNPSFSSLRRKKPNCEIQIGHFNERGLKVRIEIYLGSAHYTYVVNSKINGFSKKRGPKI